MRISRQHKGRKFYRNSLTTLVWAVEAVGVFDGNLRDSSKNGYHLVGEGGDFVPVPGGQTLKSGSGKVQTPSHPELQLVPGLRIDCSVYFEQVPTESRHIVRKDGEYQLRVNPPEEGGGFAFFVNLDGWEPRVCSDQRVVPGRWYRLTANWDGRALTLDVNGQRARVTRSGIPKPTGNPLVVGGLGGWIDNLSVKTTAGWRSGQSAAETAARPGSTGSGSSTATISC